MQFMLNYGPLIVCVIMILPIGFIVLQGGR